MARSNKKPQQNQLRLPGFRTWAKPRRRTQLPASPARREASYQSLSFWQRYWGAKESRYRSRLLHHLAKLRIEKPVYWWRERRLWQRIGLCLLAFLGLYGGTMYGIAQWYIASQRHTPIQLGTTFIPSYARYFQLDPQETYKALLNDAGIRHFRLVSYWDDIEKSAGHYDFSELDWQFKLAEQNQASISLAIGLRQPRWPECHMPAWANRLPKDEWSNRLQTFMGKVIERYHASPALQSYQLENEFFMKVFGICPDFSRDRLINEYNFVKLKDPYHPIIVSRSNNAVGLPIGQPRPDAFGVSVYKRVWDKTITKRYFEYPFPAWYYAYLAGAGQLLTGQDMVIHELQAEPWTPEGVQINDPAQIAEHNKSLNAKRLRDRINYGKATGMKTIDLWGAEYWYWRKTKTGDDSLWQVVKQEINSTQQANNYAPNLP